MIKSVAYYIVEDDPSVINVLQDIVEDRNLGTVVGTSGEDGADIDEILMKKADIIHYWHIALPGIMQGFQIMEIQRFRPVYVEG